VKGRGKLDSHIISESVLVLFVKNYQKIVHACRNDKLVRFDLDTV